MNKKILVHFSVAHDELVFVICIKIKRMTFKELHNQEKPLLLCNVWDVPSAKIAEKSGYQAIGTSSWAVAALLGYNDGEEIPFAELEYIVKRIAKSTNIPLSVDLEGGYSRKSDEIADHIKRLSDIGVSGINLEDSVVTDHRYLLDGDEFAKMLEVVREILQKDQVDIFINVRTDSFLLGHADALDVTKERIRLYESAGADGIFVPCVLSKTDIEAVVDSTALPINVLTIPNLPCLEELNRLGVKRVSMGNSLFDEMYHSFESSANAFLKGE